MKLLLIAPYKKKINYLLKGAFIPPLGLLYLAAYTPEEVELRLIDENVEPVDFSEAPDVVGITTLTPTARRAYEIADRFRAQGSKVIMGGIHASMVPDEALAHADSVVVGEAEAIWPKVLSDADSGRLEPIYRQENPVDFQNPLFPNRNIIRPRQYWSANAIQTARGCPYDCSFCSVTAFNGRRPRLRQIDNILAEIEALPRGKMIRRKVVPIVDDNIAANPHRAKEMFKALIPMRILWGSQACISFAKDEELVSLAAESGCRFLFIGLETLSPAALAEVGKRHNKIEEYNDALQMLKKYHIQVMGAFVFGIDTDDRNIFANTLEFALKHKLTLVQFSILTPYPGTRLYDQMLSEGRVKPAYWLDPSWNRQVVFKPNYLTAKELSDNTLQTQRQFYSYRCIFKRFSFLPYWNWWLVANLVYRQTVMAI